MYNVEKHSVVLENAAGFAGLDAYIYSPVTKWRHRLYFGEANFTILNQGHS